MAKPSSELNKFIGQTGVVDMLKRQLAGAQSRREPFPHAMFIGPSGVGKTELATSLAAAYKTDLFYLHGDRSPSELADTLKRLNNSDFLFLDEAHFLKSKTQELLFPVIDHFRLHNPDQQFSGNDRDEDQSFIEIKPSTIVLATDQPGRLSNALQKRIPVRVPLKFYPVSELREIVDRIATDLDMLVSPQAARLIAEVSGGLPRKAKHHLENMRRHITGASKREIRRKDVKRFLDQFGVDTKGLTDQEARYLIYLDEVGSASLESLAIHLGLDKQYVRQQVEPLLIQHHRFVVIGSKGRRLTPAGEKWIKQQNEVLIKESHHHA